MALLFLILLAAVIYAIYRSQKPSVTSPGAAASEFDLERHNRQWAQYILSYQSVVKTKAEKALLERMLKDLLAQGMTGGLTLLDDGKPVEPLQFHANVVHVQSTSATSHAKLPTLPAGVPYQDNSQDDVPPAASTPSVASQIQLDNATILLYFGAFLFVASAGMFVGFSSLSGHIKTLIVAAVSMALYASGIWLYANQIKLRQAGIAFVGIGMAVMPLVGLAAYSYIFDNTNAALVWFLTSVLCMVMYAHAMIKLRVVLLDYLFIFTIVSLFESTISLLDAPVYYFGWCLSAIGLFGALLSRSKVIGHLQMPSKTLSQFFIPLALLASLVLVSDPQGGIGQFGVSLLFAAAYYGLQIVPGGTNNTLNALIVQFCTLAGTSSVIHGVGNNSLWTASTLLLFGVLQTICVLYQKDTQSDFAVNFATGTLLTYAAAGLVGFTHPQFFAVSVVSVAIGSIAVWLHQHRNDAYAAAVIAWMAIPATYVLYVYKPTQSNYLLALWSALFLLVQGAVLLAGRLRFANDPARPDMWLYIPSAVLVMVLGLMVAPWPTFWLSLLVAGTFLVLSALQPSRGWGFYTGLATVVPLLWLGRSPGVLLATTMSALAINVVLTLFYRSDIYRWLTTGLWLCLPVAVGSGGLVGGQWSPAQYAWAYVVVAFALLLSRAIARGVVFVSGKVPLARYANSTSMSYQVGYWLAAVAATTLSLSASNSQLHTSLILAVLGIFVLTVSLAVEKNDEYMALVPVVMQAALLSVWRPIGEDYQNVYLLVSSAVGALTYFVLPHEKTNRLLKRSLQYGALWSVWVAPASILLLQNSLIMMPIGLMVAGGLYLYDTIVRAGTQTAKETWCAVIAAGLLWLLHMVGVRELQIYTHVVAALFAGFSYWRFLRNDTETGTNYMYAALATATVPLALQAMSAQAGGLYGWWLLLEQVVIMLIGMSSNRRPVVNWGLYVAVAAVLWQLRGFGWAALGALALFLIAIAIHKIQKNSQ